ncbi:MAG: hypothetical protein DI535_01450 [Citrobacter freundii]|nr:MAG: hypothetical protein DI535_01450 [Citrobacter freundii]
MKCHRQQKKPDRDIFVNFLFSGIEFGLFLLQKNNENEGLKKDKVIIFIFSQASNKGESCAGRNLL